MDPFLWPTKRFLLKRCDNFTRQGIAPGIGKPGDIAIMVMFMSIALAILMRVLGVMFLNIGLSSGAFWGEIFFLMNLFIISIKTDRIIVLRI